MGIPVIRLNLAPAPGFWRSNHFLLGWLAIGVGALALGTMGFLTWQAYQEAKSQSQAVAEAQKDIRKTAADQNKLLNELRSIDVQKELPRWKLAERLLAERASPWSRLFSELERTMVQDVRLRNLSRAKNADQQGMVKLKGEARNPEAEARFIESMQQNGYFQSVVLDREAEKQTGELDFELLLGISPTPPPYIPLPLYGPERKKATPPPSGKPPTPKHLKKASGNRASLAPPVTGGAALACDVEASRNQEGGC